MLGWLGNIFTELKAQYPTATCPKHHLGGWHAIKR